MSGMTVTYSVQFSGTGPRSHRPASTNDRAASGRRSTSPTVAPVARRLALAHYVERLVDQGVLKDYAHAAAVLGVTRARVTQLMDLLLLAPAVQERVLADGFGGSERALRRLVGDPDWESQRRASGP